MNFIRSFAIAAVVLVGMTSQSLAFQGVGVSVGVGVPVASPVVVGSVPFFYGGFWWWNNGGYWHRSHHQHGPWGHRYRGAVPYGVSHHKHHYGGGHGHHRGNSHHGGYNNRGGNSHRGR